LQAVIFLVLIVVFIGNILLVSWRNHRSQNANRSKDSKQTLLLRHDEQPLPHLLLKALACSQSLIDKYHDYTPIEGFKFGLKIALGSGDVCELIIGGVNDHWFYALTGHPFMNLKKLHQTMQPGGNAAPLISGNYDVCR
jgi:hypothetical protein